MGLSDISPDLPSEEMLPGGQWCARPDVDFAWHAFGDSLAVFSHDTADTHVLSPGASVLLSAMIADPGTERDAAMWFEIAFAGSAAEEDRADREVFSGLLVELERIGVVARRSS